MADRPSLMECRPRWRVEAQEPCGQREWIRLQHPDVYKDETWENGGNHDGLFDAETAEEAIQQWLDAYPKYPHSLTQGAKAFLAFRAYQEPSPRVFRLVEVFDA